MSTNNTYCALPFRETMLVPEGSGNGALLLCCRHNTNVVIEESFDKSFLTGKIQKIREQMLQGEPVAGCESCYAEEADGIKSMRQAGIEKYGIVENIKLTALHTAFDNVCNLRCRMCASSSSHLLYNDELEIFGKTISNKKYTEVTVYDDMDMSQMTELRLHGGEPFLSKQGEKFFKNIVQSGAIKNLKLITPTNGTVMPSGYFLQALLLCKELHINVSIDAHGKLNGYIRSGADFDMILKNLDYFCSLIATRPAGSTTIGCDTTVSIYNINQLDTLDDFMKEYYPMVRLSKGTVGHPEFLCISNMPAEYKDMVRPLLLKNKDHKKLIAIMNRTSEDYFDEFVHYHNSLDQLRKETLQDSNELLSNYISSYKSKKTTDSHDVIKLYRVNPEHWNV